MNIDLKFLGLSEKEAHIYLVMLKLGEVNAKQLTQATKIDRTTIYSVLGTLINKNLVSQHNKGKILHFSAHDPKNLLYNIKFQESRLKELLPELTDIFRTGSSQVQLRSYSGSEELINLYESILDIKGLKSYDIICSEEDWLYLNPRYFQKYKKRRAEKGIKTRLIMETSLVSESRKQESNNLSEIKFLPPAFSPLNFSSGCYILPDRVVFVSYKREHTAVEIFSTETINFMQNIFNFMWKTIS
jgi:sugar-specific transcriptional regulator TrmB